MMAVFDQPLSPTPLAAQVCFKNGLQERLLHLPRSRLWRKCRPTFNGQSLLRCSQNGVNGSTKRQSGSQKTKTAPRTVREPSE
jgi:hypothetical protein